MELEFNAFNPAASSLLEAEGPGTIEVPLTTIDLLVAELGLHRVDFIKLDIEGAEREALRGAKDTIEQHHPRFLIDRDYRLDAPIGVSDLGVTDYAGSGSWCEAPHGELEPHTVFFW